MKVLVTGGTGFIGRSLVRSLLESGHQPTVLSRRPDAVSAHCGPGVTAISNLGEWSPDISFDAVVNLAGEAIMDHRWTASRKNVLWDSRVSLTGQLVQAIARCQNKPAVLVSGSAIGIYGDHGDTSLDESAMMHGGFGHRLCESWERAAGTVEDHGVRLCILRTGLVIGRQGGFLDRMLPPFRLGLGGRIGHGRQWMSWIHMKDQVALIRYLMDTPSVMGVFNGTAPNPVTNAQFTACLAKVLQRPALLPVPGALLKLAMGERAELLLESQRVLPAKALQTGFRFSFPDLEGALEDVIGTR